VFGLGGWLMTVLIVGCNERKIFGSTCNLSIVIKLRYFLEVFCCTLGKGKLY